MKLIEIRFGNLPPDRWGDVAARCAETLQELGEDDLVVMSVPALGCSKAEVRHISVAEMTDLLKTSLIGSQQRVNREFSDIVTIKSNRSCRFIVTEDDGLLRICLASDDPVPDFSGFEVEVSDASHLLITTDLFDYI